MSEVPKSSDAAQTSGDATNPFAPIDYTSRLKAPRPAYGRLSRHAAAAARSALRHRPLDDPAQAPALLSCVPGERSALRGAESARFFRPLPFLYGLACG